MWTLKVIILALVVILTLIILFTAFYGHNTLFHPSQKIFYVSDIPHREFFIAGVHGMFFNNFPGQKVILYCHGNNANITTRKYIMDLCNKHGVNLLLFDYQGYGKSSGTPFQYSIQPDAQTAYNYLIDQGVCPQDIVVWGESLGGNPATFLASQNQVSQLILLSTFSSMSETFSDYNWHYVQKIVEQIFDRSDTSSRLKSVKCPVTIIHSRDDEIIPFKGAERLYDAVNHSMKKLIPISGPHGNPSIDPDILDQLVINLKNDNF